MPPKSKITKEAIIDIAFAITRENGFDHVTARLLAKELNCSTQPIFHIFEKMDDIKSEVYKKTRTYFTEYMFQSPENSDIPLFLNMGLRYVELAQTEKHLFRLLCMSDSFQLNSIYDLANNIPLQIDTKTFIKTWIFTHGIASIIATNTTTLSQIEIQELLIEASKDFYHEY